MVQSDGSGRYAIGIEGRDILFITKPVGYTTPIHEYNLPQFYNSTNWRARSVGD